MSYTVLIVDDKLLQCDQLVYSLRNRLGYRTLTSASGSEALHRLCTETGFKPDLILFDCSPERQAETGYLKELSLHAPLVAMVKYGDYDAATAALNAGAQDFIVKPAAIERISTTFRNLLLLRDMRRKTESLSHTPPFAPSFSLLGEDKNIRPMDEIEAEVIRFALQYYHGRMTEVARRLKIGRSTLYRKLSNFSVQHDEAAA
jgi:DNA-binding NtrC family response regulator